MFKAIARAYDGAVNWLFGTEAELPPDRKLVDEQAYTDAQVEEDVVGLLCLAAVDEDEYLTLLKSERPRFHAAVVRKLAEIRKEANEPPQVLDGGCVITDEDDEDDNTQVAAEDKEAFKDLDRSVNTDKPVKILDGGLVRQSMLGRLAGTDRLVDIAVAPGGQPTNAYEQAASKEEWRKHLGEKSGPTWQERAARVNEASRVANEKAPYFSCVGRGLTPQDVVQLAAVLPVVRCR